MEVRGETSGGGKGGELGESPLLSAEGRRVVLQSGFRMSSV